MIALLPLFLVACGGSSGGSNGAPTGPTSPTDQVTEANGRSGRSFIYVADGRPPRGNDFAVYDPATDGWQVLPVLPTQRNHITGEAINARIHVAGGRQGDGLSPLMTTAHEVFDPRTHAWTTAAPIRAPAAA